VCVWLGPCVHKGWSMEACKQTYLIGADHGTISECKSPRKQVNRVLLRNSINDLNFMWNSESYLFSQVNHGVNKLQVRPLS